MDPITTPFDLGEIITMRFDQNAPWWTGQVIAMDAPHGRRKTWSITLLCEDGKARWFPVVA